MAPRHSEAITDPLALLEHLALAELTTRQRVEHRAAWAADPVLYAREVLGIEPWSRQQEILEAVRDHDRVTCRSGHKTGKSTSAAILARWWTCDPQARPGARVVMTSASARQVRSILWRELRRITKAATIPLDGGILHGVPDAGLQWDDGREILGLSTNEPEKMAGFSGAWVLFILDEASGILNDIFEAIEGNRAGGARLVMFSNPTRTTGEFFDSFHGKRNFYRTIHISSEETPNAVSGTREVPGLATRAWIEEKKAEWGEDSPLYQVRVRGNFPAQSSNAIIGLALLEAAVARWKEAEEAADDAEDPDPALRAALEDGPLSLGLDVARDGDDETILYYRRGRWTYPPIVIPNGDGRQTAGHVLQAMATLRRPGERPRIKIDSNGLGASPYDFLKEASDAAEGSDDAFDIVGVKTGESSTSPEEYFNLRSQLHFAGRDYLRAGGALPDDAKTLQELLAPTYSFDARNRFKVQSKDEIKKLLQPARSPDRADGWQLCVYEPPAEACADADGWVDAFQDEGVLR